MACVAYEEYEDGSHQLSRLLLLDLYVAFRHLRFNATIKCYDKFTIKRIAHSGDQPEPSQLLSVSWPHQIQHQYCALPRHQRILLVEGAVLQWGLGAFHPISPWALKIQIYVGLMK